MFSDQDHWPQYRSPRCVLPPHSGLHPLWPHPLLLRHWALCLKISYFTRNSPDHRLTIPSLFRDLLYACMYDDLQIWPFWKLKTNSNHSRTIEVDRLRMHKVSQNCNCKWMVSFTAVVYGQMTLSMTLELFVQTQRNVMVLKNDFPPAVRKSKG